MTKAGRKQILTLLGLIVACISVQAGPIRPVVTQEKPGPVSFTPENPPSVSYRDGSVTIQPTYSVDNRVSILIRESASPLRREVMLPDEVAQLNEVRPVDGNKIAAVGLVNSAVSMVTIIERKTGAVIDAFYGYSPVISPDGRWMAFQEFFPPHGSDDIKSCYRVYDFSLNASQNRHGQIDGSDPRLVGTSVYPVRPRSQQVKCGATSKDREFMLSTEAFLWGSQSDRFVFGVSDDHVLNLVLVKLNESRTTWQTFVYDLNKDKNLCMEKNCNMARLTALELGEEAVTGKVFPGNLGAAPLNLSIPVEKFVLIKPQG